MRIVDDYILQKSLKPESVDWYQRIARVFCNWYGGDCSLTEFSPAVIARFLVAKQKEGRSSYYCRSLRNGLVALRSFALGEDAPRERIRGVRVIPLIPDAWDAADVQKLVKACETAPLRKERDREEFATIILAAWYTGMSTCDLWRICTSNIKPSGLVVFYRSKTNKAILTSMPKDLIDRIKRMRPSGGQIWPLRTSKERFRRKFKVIVEEAGLSGSFKKLRISSGTEIERLYPGRGHEHLANSRAVFEKHYHDVSKTRTEALVPTHIDVVVPKSEP